MTGGPTRPPVTNGGYVILYVLLAAFVWLVFLWAIGAM